MHVLTIGSELFSSAVHTRSNEEVFVCPSVPFPSASCFLSVCFWSLQTPGRKAERSILWPVAWQTCTYPAQGAQGRDTARLLGTSLSRHCPLEACACHAWRMRKLGSHRTRDVFLPMPLVLTGFKRRPWLGSDWVRVLSHTKGLNGPACLSLSTFS